MNRILFITYGLLLLLSGGQTLALEPDTIFQFSREELIEHSKSLPTINQKTISNARQEYTATIAAMIFGEAWSKEIIERRLKSVASVYLQCGIHFDKIMVYKINPDDYGMAEKTDGVYMKKNLSEALSRFDVFQRVSAIGYELTEANIPTLVYWTGSPMDPYEAPAESFPILPQSPMPKYMRNGFAYIPYEYEKNKDVEKDLSSRDVMVEGHELGHLFGLVQHQWPSPLMSGGLRALVGDAADRQTNEIYPEDCDRLVKSRYVKK